MSDWNRLGRHVLSAESIDSFKRRLDASVARDDRWDYSKGGEEGTALCGSPTGLLQSPHFLCSYKKKIPVVLDNASLCLLYKLKFSLCHFTQYVTVVYNDVLVYFFLSIFFLNYSLLE